LTPSEFAGIGALNVADDAGFVDIFVDEADVGSRCFICFWPRIRMSVSGPGDFAPLLRGIVFILADGDAVIGAARPRCDAARYRAWIISRHQRFSGMTNRTRWTKHLTCPSCEKSGVAKLSQAGVFAFSRGETTTSIDDTPDGFTYSRRGSDITFACGSCRVRID
jgi:hypothetical protein